jgi:hypothetical protein
VRTYFYTCLSISSKMVPISVQFEKKALFLNGELVAACRVEPKDCSFLDNSGPFLKSESLEVTRASNSSALAIN